MATFHDTVLTELRIIGQRAYVGGVMAAESAIGGLQKTTVGFVKTMGDATRSMARGSFGLDFLERQTKRAAVGAGLLAGVAGVIGIKFNAAMETSTLAFAELLHSESAAKNMLAELFELAAKTPFEFPQLVDAGQKLLGFGMKADEVVPLLTKVGDAVAAVGADPERIDRITRALGQMQAKGKVYSEELLQLADAGLPAYKILADQMGLTGDQLNKQLRKGAISADEGLTALSKGMEKMYSGMSAKQAKTFNGLISTLKDYSRQLLGALTKPLFDVLRKDVLPVFAKFTQDAQRWLTYTGLTTKERFEAIKTSAEYYLKPLGKKFVDWWNQNHVGEKLQAAVEWGLGKIGEALPGIAKKAAETFVKAWWQAGIWTKIFTGLYLAKKLGIFTALGNAAATKMVDSFTRNWGGKKGKEKWKNAGKMAGRGIMLGLVLAVTALAPDIANFIQDKLGIKGEKFSWKGVLKERLNAIPNFGKDIWRHMTGPQWKLGGRQAGGPVSAHRPYTVGEAGMELFVPRVPGTIIPTPQLAAPKLGGLLTMHNLITLDGREVYKSVTRHTADALARR